MRGIEKPKLNGGQALALARKLVVEHEHELTKAQFKAFSEMVERGYLLSEKQAKWVMDAAERIGLDPARNLFSELSPEEKREHRKQVRTRLPWETGEVKRPLKPPGRSE